MSWIVSKEKYSSFLQQQSSKWKEKGNNSFKAHRYDEAIEEYTTAMLLAKTMSEIPARTSTAHAFYNSIVFLVFLALANILAFSL